MTKINHIRTSIFKHWNKPLYIASKQPEVEIDEYNNEIVNYDKPIFLGNINYQPLLGYERYAYMKAYGETQSKLQRAYIDISNNGKFKEFDLAYLNGATPKGEQVNGQNANYRVKTCTPQNTVIFVVFEEIIKEGN